MESWTYIHKTKKSRQTKKEKEYTHQVHNLHTPYISYVLKYNIIFLPTFFQHLHISSYFSFTMLA